MFLCYNYTTETKAFKEVHPYVFSITDHDKRTASLYSYCMETTAASKRLYNAALFRIRNRFTGYRKVALTDHELQVLEELDTL